MELLETSLDEVKTHINTLETQNQTLSDQIEYMEERLINEYDDKNGLKATIDRLTLEQEAKTEELQDFYDMMEDMKTVAGECEEKDLQLNELRLKLEEAEERVFCLEAKEFKIEGDRREMEELICGLKEELEIAQERICEFEQLSKVRRLVIAI